MRSAFLAGGLSESDEKVLWGSGLSDSSLTAAFLAGLESRLSLSGSLLLLLLLPLSSAFLRSLLTDFLCLGLLLTDLLRRRGGVEGLRRLRGGVRSLGPPLMAARCRYDKGLLPRLMGDERLPLDLQLITTAVACTFAFAM